MASTTILARSNETAEDVSVQTPWAFIVGAPRCGTTFLARHLARHPDVCFSNVKEPHFFASTDLSALSDDALRHAVTREYLDRYFPDPQGRTFFAEASVTSLYAPEHLEPILRLWPKAKFVVALRDPLTMLPSLHQRLRYNGDDTIKQFEQAWALVPERRAGRHIPRGCAEPRWLDYWESGKLGKYLERLFAVVGRERCFVSLFDDLVEDPAGQYRGLLEFLGLPDDGQKDFGPERATRGFKIEWLQRLLKRPPRAALAVFASEQYRARFDAPDKSKSGAVSRVVMKARKRLLDWNKTQLVSESLSPEIQSQIHDMYADDVALLEQLIGRDLGSWLGRQGHKNLRIVPSDAATAIPNFRTLAVARAYVPSAE